MIPVGPSYYIRREENDTAIYSQYRRGRDHREPLAKDAPVDSKFVQSIVGQKVDPAAVQIVEKTVYVDAPVPPPVVKIEKNYIQPPQRFVEVERVVEKTPAPEIIEVKKIVEVEPEIIEKRVEEAKRRSVDKSVGKEEVEKTPEPGLKNPDINQMDWDKM